MNAKLTLSLNQTVIAAAKEFARANKTSVSHLVENYFTDLLYAKPRKFSKEVEELIGMGYIENPPEDLKKEKLAYLEEKYLNR